MIRIVTDSTADLPAELLDQYRITVVPLKVIFNGEEPLLDSVDLNSDEFFRRQVEKREMSSTSQPTPAEFAAAYSRLAENGTSIISIHISSVMSGTVQSAKMAKEMLPGADIEIIDSRVTSMGLGLVVLEAARAAAGGKSKTEILALIENILSKIQVFFIVDTLEYLARGGRIGKAQAFLGTILNIKPLLYLKEGTIFPYEKVRGKAKAIERLVQVAEEMTGGQKIKCSIVHGANPGGMEQLRQKLIERVDCEEIVISKLGSVVGTHTGPGVVGIVFFTL